MRGSQLLKLIDVVFGSTILQVIKMFRIKRISLPEIKSTIVVVKLSAIGDTILLYPALRALKERFPIIRIVAVCTKINFDIFARCSYVDRVIRVDPLDLLLHPWSSFKPLFDICPDLTIDFDQWTRLSTIIAVATRPKFLIGFLTDGQNRHFVFDLAVPHSRKEHEIECFLKLSKAAGAISMNPRLEFAVSDQEKADVQNYLKKHNISPGGFIVLHPETPQHGTQRHWPISNFIDLGKMIVSQTDKYILLTGTHAESISNEAIKAAVGVKIVNVPPSNIGFIAALYQNSACLVCGNTGIMHLACALDRPVVALHGPTDPVKWGPRSASSVVVSGNLPCSPCLYLGFEYGCHTNRCMRAITPEMAFSSVKKILQTQS